MTIDASQRDSLIKAAHDPRATPFDYVIVGSGAGGGPLAARLAEEGRRVLLIEAGVDAAAPLQAAVAGAPAAPDREVYRVPAYHAAATEDPVFSWEYSVRHYDDDARQRKDSKYDAAKDPSAGLAPEPGKGGIQYPRAAAIGGCTAHHAMIVIRPNDADWDQIAEFTGDDSWRSEHMQGYFGKIENCLYYAAYRGFAGKLFGGLLRWVQRAAAFINPRRQLDPGGHGFKGWQTTSFIDPLVIARIAWRDGTFLRVLLGVIFSALTKRGASTLLGRALLRFQLLQFLDPNVRSPEIPTRDHLSLISIGTDGRYRNGLRERLLKVAEEHPKNLVILNPAHVMRVLFEASPAGAPPQAIGVEAQIGAHLYHASPMATQAAGAPLQQFFARREVILCGGSFSTPQLLMLSGIGDRTALGALGIEGPCGVQGRPVAPVVHLPGVGRNLQDRYEVSVVSKIPKAFSTLDGASFVPDDVTDPVRDQWLKDGSGLYATNGGAVAMMLSSKAWAQTKLYPDLFVFGVPAAFRGYYWGWSKQLLSSIKGAPPNSRDLWTWVILKAYTDNNQGAVTLRSADPLDVPQIDFNSFPRSAAGQPDADLDALCEAVEGVRHINGNVALLKAANEVQPGPALRDGSPDLRQWVMDEAWGHHACGTCRMGPDPWRADATTLEDAGAVLDSSFRVHGVTGLRVVDASVFPSIPGYFIVTPIFMIGEKAADVLLADRAEYPRRLEAAEAGAVQRRREVAMGQTPRAESATTLPADTVGLALSGGGIRSATFCLGVLQAIAGKGRLRDIDFLSTVSGGGYIGAFLGRLFTRQPDDAANKVKRVEAVLVDPASPEVGWLRQNAQYIDGGGRATALADLATVVRNLASIHVWIGALFFGIFGVLRGIAEYAGLGRAAPMLLDLRLSAWWWLPGLLVAVLVVPASFGYWLVLRDTRRNWRALLPFGLWVVLLGCGIAGLAVPAIQVWSVGFIVVMLLSWFIQEAAGWGVPVDRSPLKWGREPNAEEAEPVAFSTVVRNRLTRLLGSALLALAVSVLWVLLDTLAQAVARDGIRVFGWSMVGVAALLPMLRGWAVKVLKAMPAAGQAPRSGLSGQLGMGLVACMLFLGLLWGLDILAHYAFRRGFDVGLWWTLTAILASAALGHIEAFLNLSSLQQAFSQKLVRSFLGASNTARVYPTGTNAPVPVDVSDLDDDTDFDEYHPECKGGPLHLVGTCVNNTVDPLSGNQLRHDKGMPLCAGPAGLSVGRRFHALWARRGPKTPARFSPVDAVPTAPDPNQFHVLARREGDKPVLVERLRLGQWMAISGAAYSTGTGRDTRLAKSLLLGILNVRIGYWWNSGLAAGDRPGRYPPRLWRRLKSLPSTVFRLQASLLDEWRAYFAGPAERLWYLSDGGHFDNTGLYELIRRRLPVIVAVDATHDERYVLDDLALLTRRVRLDFCATIEWFDPAPRRSAAPAATGWNAIADPLDLSLLPAWIRSSVDPDAIDGLSRLRRTGPLGAALARIHYADEPGRSSWLLFIKPCLLSDLPTDVNTYAALHDAFPNQSTLDQFFDDDQWEAYRMLGLIAGRRVFR